MKHIRWYDKNPDLKEVFEFIQELDSDVQKEIAKDILQILMNDFNLNLDEQINDIGKNYNYDCKRWYDENIDLFTSFEIIKTFSIETQAKIINKIITAILLLHLEKEKV